MAGKKTPTTFNGNNINDGTIYVSKFLRESGIGEVFESEAVTAEITREFPQYLMSQPRGRVLRLWVELKRKGTANHFADLNTLKQYFSTRQGPCILKATDEASSPNTLRLVVKPIAMLPVEGTDWLYEVSLWVSEPVWKLDAVEVTSEQITASEERWTTVNNAGSDHVRPETKITVATTASAYKASGSNKTLMRHVVVANRSANTLQDANGNPYPIEVTGGGWDVETEIKAGRMHPQGYDLLVFVNGAPVNRWLSNFGAGFGTVGTLTPSNYKSFESGAIAYHAQMFFLPGCSERETNTVDEVVLAMKKVGAPLGTLRLRIRADSNNSPGAVVTNGTSNTINTSTLGTTGAFFSFTFAVNPVLTARTRYWLELDVSGISAPHDASNYVQIMVATSSDGYEGELADALRHSPDATTWSQPHGGADIARSAAFRVYTTGNAKIWVPMLLDPMIKRTLDRGLTSGSSSPFRVNDADGTAPLPDQCAVVIDSECLIVRKKPGTTDELWPMKTGARGTTTGAHKAGTAMYWSQADVRIVFGHDPQNDAGTLGKTKYEPDPLAPVIDGVNSTNTSLKWIGPFAAFNEEIRPLAWRTELDDSQVGYATVTMDGDPAADDVNITFKDAVPAGSYIMRNVATQYFPAGIKQAASAISVDATPIAAGLEVQHLLTNARGEEELIATHRNADAGAGKLITPTDEAYRYRLRVRNGNVLYIETNDAQTYSNSAMDVWPGLLSMLFAQSFTVDETTTITGAAVRCRRDNLRTFTAKVVIGKCDADGNFVSEIIAESATFTNADVAVTPTWTTISKTFATPPVVGEGMYWVGVIFTVLGGSGNFTVSTTPNNTSPYPRGEFVGGTNRDMWCRVFGTPPPADAVTGTGGTVDLDNITVTLDDATPGTPFVAFQSANQSCWLLDAELWNVSNKKDIGVTLAEAIDGAGEAQWDLSHIPPELAFIISQSNNRYLQADAEKVLVVAVRPNDRTRTIDVTRASLGTAQTTHAQGDPLYLLHQRVKLLAPMQAGESITIDWENRTVIHSDDDLSTPYQPVAIVELDEEDPFTLGPGANELMYVETGLTAGITVDVQATYREAWL